MRLMLTMWHGVTAAAALSLMSTAAAAQSSLGDDEPLVPEASSLQLGVPRGLRLSANLTTLYSSNILRVGDGLAPQPGAQKSDVRFSPSVEAQYNLSLGRRQLFVSGLVGRDYYANNTRLDKNRYRISAGAVVPFGARCVVNGNASFTSRQVQVSDAAELVPSVRQALLLGGSFNCQSAVGLGFGGNVRHSQQRNLAPGQQQLDLDTTGYGANLSYGLGVIGRVSLSGSMSNISYVNRSALLPDGSSVADGARITSGRLGFDRSLGARTQVTLGVSYFKSAPRPRTVLELVGFTPSVPPLPIVAQVDRPSFSSLGYDAAVAYKPSSRLSVTLAAQRSATASPNVLARTVISNNLSTNFDYQLGSALSLNAGGSFDRRQYQNAILGPADQFRRRIEDKLTRVYAGVSYVSPRRLRISTEVAYQQRKSNPVEFSNSGVAVTVNLGLTFGRQS